ncbi:MAG TPA: hypothetical protein VNH15_07725 [Elusimicrobiota bacterium]|nr:hypothetical protein [Elusimicrobiota bacterium]
MKKIILAIGILAVAGASWAQQAGELGGGVVLGYPVGGTLKYWLSGRQAVDGGIGAADGTVLYADYLWHGWNILPQPKQGKLGVYAGLGPRLDFEDAGTNEFAIRTMVGLDYWISNHPIELFAEVGPVFRLSPSGDVSSDGGIGVRFYFSGVPGKAGG